MRQWYLLLCICFTFNFFKGAGQTLDSFPTKAGALFYHQSGTGAPVILLSGGPGGSYAQLSVVATEISKNYRAILPEQRGTGLSIPTPFDSTTINLQTAVEDLNLLLQHLKLSQSTFIGHSWGSMLAMSFAAAHPDKVKALILIGPGPLKEWEKNFQILQMNWKSRMGRLEQLGFDTLTQKIMQGTATGMDTLARRKMILETFNFDKSLTDSIQGKISGGSNLKMRDLMLNDLKKRYDLSQSLKNFKGPIHVICGRQDYVLYNAYELKLIMPVTELHWIERCGHWPQFEQPKAFFQSLEAILKQVH